jgi:hypothetical protein
MTVEIINIKIRIGDRDIDLTPKEARDFHQKLGELFDYITVTPSPYPVIYYPVTWYPFPSYPQTVKPWEITWITYNSGSSFQGSP